MKVAYLTGPRRIEVREASAPAPSSPADVLVRIDAVGVCGSDIHYFTQGGIGASRVKYPFIMGHECAGTVLEASPGVTALKPGDRVAIDPLIACGKCDQCLARRRHTCRHQKFLGVPGQISGALVERILLPADCCFPVPATMTMPQAVMVEPFSVAVHAVRLAALAPPARVGVLGSGPIGLCVMLALRAMLGREGGAGVTIYSTDLVEERLEAARRTGAVWAGSPRRENIVAAIREREPAGLDCVFECAGEQETLDQAVALLTPGGASMLVGIPEADRISFDAHELRHNELRVATVRRQNLCTQDALDLIASGRANVDPLVTHHFPLGQTSAAFELVTARRDGVLKAIIDVPGN
jgi:L-iditol 2-dehydrogenase